MRSRLALLFAALLLAGCASLAGGPATDDPTATGTPGTTAPATTASPSTTTSPPTTTTDPEPTTTVTTPPASLSYLDGVGPDGLVNRTRLLDENWDALTSRGYVAESWQNVSVARENGTHHHHVRATVGAGGFPAHVAEQTTSVSGFGTTSERWANETVALSRVRRATNDSFSYRHEGYPTPVETNPTAADLSDLLALGDFEITSVEGAGDIRRFTLTASRLDPDPGAFIPNRDRLTGFSGELVVDSRGVVHRFTATVESEVQGYNQTKRVTYDLLETEVQRAPQPAWAQDRLPDALEVTVAATMVDDRFIRVTNTGRATVPANSRLQLWWAACGRSETTLDAPLEPGETIYAYVDADENSRLGVNRTAPVGSARPLDNPADFSVYSPNSSYRNPLAQTDVRAATTDAATDEQSHRGPAVARFPGVGATGRC